MTAEPQFTIAQVVAVYHDRLACDFTSQRELIDHMAGQRVPIWDIPVVLKLAQPALKRQFPWLDRVPLPGSNRSDLPPGKYMREVVRRAGADAVAVKPLRKGAYRERSGLEAMA